MHPHTFIDELWNGHELDEVFVAMSFHESYADRFTKVYRPAVEGIKVNGNQLRAVIVNESKSGDSIITEIVRGISNARIVLADISSMGPSADGYNVQRNGNVMYELGIAHAVKSPSKVIIVRDDRDKLLFDVSSIPHETIDFSNVESAKKIVSALITDRIEEGDKILDIKLLSLSKSMTPHEFELLEVLAKCPKGKYTNLTREVSGHRITPNFVVDGLRGLLPAGIVESLIFDEPNYPLYSLTERGRRLSLALKLETSATDKTSTS